MSESSFKSGSDLSFGPARSPVKVKVGIQVRSRSRHRLTPGLGSGYCNAIGERLVYVYAYMQI